MASGSCWKASLIIGSLLSFIMAMTLTVIYTVPGISPFNSSIGNMSHKYDTGITPSDATFSIWSLIYVWQLAIVIYSMTLLCRTSNGEPLYVSPGFIPPIFFVYYILTIIGNPVWIAVFCQGELIWSQAVILCGVITLAGCLENSCKQLESSGTEMVKKGLKADIWCTRIIVHNGIALSLAWISCAATISTIMVLHYNLDFAMSCVCYGGLIALNTVLVGWFIMETFLYDRQLRYVFGHYIGYIIAFVGIYVRRYDPDVPYTIYALALLVFVCVLALAKLIIMIVRAVKDPIHYPKVRYGDKVYLIEDDYEKLKSIDY